MKTAEDTSWKATITIILNHKDLIGFLYRITSQNLKEVSLRGLHFQKKYPQGKLIRVISGEVFDVAVDLRQNSPSFRKWFGIILSSENKKQLYIPPGFAHGFLVLSDEAEFFYKCTEYYHPEDEDGILWNDDKIRVEWPLGQINQLIVSEKDKKWKPLENV